MLQNSIFALRSAFDTIRLWCYSSFIFCVYSCKSWSVLRSPFSVIRSSFSVFRSPHFVFRFPISIFRNSQFAFRNFRHFSHFQLSTFFFVFFRVIRGSLSALRFPSSLFRLQHFFTVFSIQHS